jgi:hypothetical protein
MRTGQALSATAGAVAAVGAAARLIRARVTESDMRNYSR